MSVLLGMQEGITFLGCLQWDGWLKAEGLVLYNLL